MGAAQHTALTHRRSAQRHLPAHRQEGEDNAGFVSTEALHTVAHSQAIRREMGRRGAGAFGDALVPNCLRAWAIPVLP